METLQYYLVTKAPFQIPANIREIIVKFGPWLNLLFVLSFIPVVLSLLGLNHMFSYGYMMTGWSLYSIFSLASFVLCALALPGLFKRSISGWNMVFYSSIVSFAGNVIYGDILGGLVGLIIGLYILFQIRSYYR